MKVSVIIPTYKHRDFILTTLSSVFAQTFSDYEVIVINDGSPDDTAEVLRPLVEAGRIRYIEQENRGQSAARNRGLAEARGDLIAYLDDDDVWPQDKLAWQVVRLKAEPEAVLVYGPMETLGAASGQTYPGSEAPSGWVHGAFLKMNYIVSPGQALIRRAALQAIGGFDESLWGTDDWDLYIRLASKGEFVFADNLALSYRRHDGNASKNTRRLYLNSCRLQYKHLGIIPKPGDIISWLSCRRFIIKYISQLYLEQAHRLTLEGKKKEARRQWLELIRINPATLRRPAHLRQILSCFM